MESATPDGRPRSLASLAAHVANLADAVRRDEDRRAVVGLCERYLAQLDEGGFSEKEAGRLFTDDVTLAFPPGTHRGIAGLDEFTEHFMGHWARTHHHASAYAVEVTGDWASVVWNVIATHVHRDSPPPPASGHHFQIGGRFDGVAVRTPDGWRIRVLRFQVVWTTGSGVPAIAATMTGARHAGQ